jgi:hypothetical protein
MATRIFTRLNDFVLNNTLALKAYINKICDEVETQFDSITQAQTDIAANVTDIAGVVADVASLQTEVDTIGADNILSKVEKLIVIRGVNDIINEKSGLDTQATTLGITTEKTTYDTKYTALVTTYLGGLSPAYTDTTQNTTIVRATWNTKFNDYYTAKQALINKIGDVASAQSVVIDPFPTVTIYADSGGAVKSGQLTRIVQLTASKGGTAVTTLGAWARTTTSGVACTIGASTGSVSITALTASDVSVPVTFTYLGVVRTATLRIIRQDDPPTNSGGAGATGGTSSSTTTLGNSTSTSYDTTNAVSDTLTVTAGSVGQVACVAPITFDRVTSTDGETGAFGKWQWRVPAGVWADITTEVQEAVTAVNDAVDLANDHYGSLSVSHTKTGLTNGSSYEFRFLWHDRTVSGASRVTRASGTMTATGT